jgi:RimJ/RimL family protein N-acetyltransferase
VTFERSTNYRLVHAILTADARSYDAMGDDAAPAREAFRPNESPAIWYVIARADDGRALGLFVFVPLNSILWEIHNCFLPNAWGARALAAGRAVLPWFFAHSTARRIVGATPANNRLAVRYALKCGMVPYGTNPGAFQKHGVLHDLVLTGIDRPK